MSRLDTIKELNISLKLGKEDIEFLNKISMIFDQSTNHFVEELIRFIRLNENNLINTSYSILKRINYKTVSAGKDSLEAILYSLAPFVNMGLEILNNIENTLKLFSNGFQIEDFDLSFKDNWTVFLLLTKNPESKMKYVAKIWLWLLGDNSIQLEVHSIGFSGTFIDRELYDKLWGSLETVVERIKNYHIELPEDLVSLIYGWEDMEPELDLNEGKIVYIIHVQGVNELPSIDEFNNLFKFIYEKAGIKEYIDKELLVWRIVDALFSYIRFLRNKKPEENEPLFKEILDQKYEIAVRNCYEKDPSIISIIEDNYLVNSMSYNRLLNCVREILNMDQ